MQPLIDVRCVLNFKKQKKTTTISLRRPTLPKAKSHVPKMFCVRDGIDVPLHDALIIRTTNKNCELSEGEELDTYVRSVLENSPAYRVGVRPGDIILSIAGLQIKNSKHPSGL